MPVSAATRRRVLPRASADVAKSGVATGVESNRVFARQIAEQKNDAALTTNATSRPNAAVTRPPTDAPMASIADHVAADKAFAGSSTSADVTLGIVAVRAGSKNADAATTNAITTYAIHT